MTDLRLSRIFTAALCAALLTSGLALAQGQPAPPPAKAGAAGPGGGPGAGRPGGPPPYDKSTETTVKGTVDEVKLVDTPSGVKGTRLVMKQGGQTLEVFAGPKPFFDRQNVTFTKGAAVEVIGSKMQFQGANALIARQIKVGGKTVNPRDESGNPAWAPKPQ